MRRSAFFISDSTGITSETLGHSLLDLRNLTVQTTRANEIIERKAMSWTRLFNVMETVLPYEVRMRSIRPSFRIGQEQQMAVRGREAIPEGALPVTVEGVAQNLEGFLEFERNLLVSSHFDRIEPERNSISEATVQIQVAVEPNQPGQFTNQVFLPTVRR